MNLSIVRNLQDFEALSGEWNALLSKSASHVPFLRHEYLTTWWRTLGGGEWSQGDLFIITAREENGELVGIAPLFLTRNQQGQPALMLLGSFEISDFLDFIALPDHLPGFIDAVLDLLSGPEAPPWQVLDLYNLLEDSPTLPVLQSAARRCGWRYHQVRLQPSPFIRLPGDWDLYLKSIDKKQRHEIRRKIRRAEGYPQSVRWYIVEKGDLLDQEVEAFLDLMAQDGQKAAFLTSVMRTQMRSAVRAAFDAGWLQLSFLEVSGEKAAAYLNFDYGNRVWVYNSALSAEYRDLSPGWVLLAYLLQWANENGRAEFDFMRGAEDYKYRFGAVDRFVVRTTIQRS
jgi:CelD/BcsL family acetyltransferase involved in cellulose biosynthesis